MEDGVVLTHLLTRLNQPAERPVFAFPVSWHGDARRYPLLQSQTVCLHLSDEHVWYQTFPSNRALRPCLLELEPVQRGTPFPSLFLDCCRLIPLFPFPFDLVKRHVERPDCHLRLYGLEEFDAEALPVAKMVATAFCHLLEHT